MVYLVDVADSLAIWDVSLLLVVYGTRTFRLDTTLCLEVELEALM